MDVNAALETARLFQRVLGDLQFSLAPGTRVLDYGCGEGAAVEAYRRLGYETYGCDVVLRRQSETVWQMDPATYRIPTADETFDLVVSTSVFEHVQDHDKAFAELRRVLRPGGACLHSFPAKWRPIEPHVFVPFATVLQNKPWLVLWAMLGVRNSYQQGMSRGEVADRNYKYLKSHTNYHSRQSIKRSAAASFAEVTFVERVLLKHHPGRARLLLPILRVFPAVARLYGACWTCLLYCRRAPA